MSKESSVSEERAMTDFSVRFLDENDEAREKAIDECFHSVCKDEELARRMLQPLLKHSEPTVRYCAAVVILNVDGRTSLQ